jgi:hypothetical protein
MAYGRCRAHRMGDAVDQLIVDVVRPAEIMLPCRARWRDTSAAVPCFCRNRPASRAAWFAQSDEIVVAGDGRLTESASALALKQRRRELTPDQAEAVWPRRSAPPDCAGCRSPAARSPQWRTRHERSSVACAPATRCTLRLRSRSVLPVSRPLTPRWQPTRGSKGSAPSSSNPSPAVCRVRYTLCAQSSGMLYGNARYLFSPRPSHAFW